MNLFTLFSLCLFLSLLASGSYAQSLNLPAATVTEAVDNMLQAIESTHTLRFKLKAQERIDGSMYYTENDVCMQSSPFRVYMKQWNPDKGVEVLYCEGQRDGNALIKPAGFPYVNVKLNPLGSIMRQNQHHTIFESGFQYMATLIQDAIDYAGADGADYVTMEFGVEVNGYLCDKLVIDNPDFAWSTVTVNEKLTLYKLGRENRVSAYMIAERNNLKISTPLHPGSTIKVPNTYAKKVVLYLDRGTSLPVLQEIYDDKGLFEKYEFLFVECNPALDESEFSHDHTSYGF